MRREPRRGRGDERPGHARPRRRGGHGPEPAPPDMHAAVEQDQGQRDGDRILHRDMGQPGQLRPEVGGCGRGQQEERGRGNPQPLTDPAGQGRHDDHRRDGQDDHAERCHPGHQQPEWQGGSAQRAGTGRGIS